MGVTKAPIGCVAGAAAAPSLPMPASAAGVPEDVLLHPAVAPVPTHAGMMPATMFSPAGADWPGLSDLSSVSDDDEMEE